MATQPPARRIPPRPQPAAPQASAPAPRASPHTATLETEVTRKRGKAVLEQRGEVQHSPSTQFVNPATVAVSGKVTRNLGDFNSVSVSVFLSRPCLDTTEERERVYQETEEWVTNKCRSLLETESERGA